MPNPARRWTATASSGCWAAAAWAPCILAYDTTLHRQVALKVLTGLTDSETSHDRLLREARSAAALNHPSICTIHEVGDANGSAFIAMEYVEGRSLAHQLEEGPLPVEETLQYGIQAADALAYAHDRGVIHRDFKAANAIVTHAGRLKIVDFGLARRRDAAMAEATTAASLAPIGALAGTPYAMAPEQVRGEAADARSDIWALGVLLHEMVSGTKPFEAATIPELFSSILRDAPRPSTPACPPGCARSSSAASRRGRSAATSRKRSARVARGDPGGHNRPRPRGGTAWHSGAGSWPPRCSSSRRPCWRDSTSPASATGSSGARSGRRPCASRCCHWTI